MRVHLALNKNKKCRWTIFLKQFIDALNGHRVGALHLKLEFKVDHSHSFALLELTLNSRPSLAIDCSVSPDGPRVGL